jgi:hypothetical protein
MHERKASRIGWFLAVVFFLTNAGCGADHDVEVVLDFAGQSRTDLISYVVGIYDRPACDFVENAFPLGFNENTASGDRVYLQTFVEGGGSPIGELPAGPYAFVGLGLDESCRELFVGCALATVGEAEEVVIEMSWSVAGEEDQFCAIDAMRVCRSGRCQDLM